MGTFRTIPEGKAGNRLSSIPRYLGRIRLTSWPICARALESAPATSASPPVLAKGTASGEANRIFIVFSSWGQLSQEFGGLFGGRGIDKESGAPFKTGELGQLGNDLKVPVVVL